MHETIRRGPTLPATHCRAPQNEAGAEEKTRNVFLFRHSLAPDGCYGAVRVIGGGGWGDIHQIDMLFHVKSCRSGLQWPQTEMMAGRPLAPAS